MPIFRFRLRFNRNGQICIAGFCGPADAEPDDIAIWLPHIASQKADISAAAVRTAKYIVANVGDQFCRLVEQEQECSSWSGGCIDQSVAASHRMAAILVSTS